MRLCWWQWTVPQEGSDSASTEKTATAEGEDMKEEAEKEPAKEIPEPKKVSVPSDTELILTKRKK